MTAPSRSGLAAEPLTGTIVWHLLPGALTTAGFAALVGPVTARGYPAMFALLLATALILIPVELIYLLVRARRAGGRWSAVVAFRDPVPISQYLLWPALLSVWGIGTAMVAAPVEGWLRGLFEWLPGWYFAPSAAELAAYPVDKLQATFWLGLVVGGFAGPIVEELYFRGHLLPRLGRAGRWAPLAGAALFSAYHFWTPWQNPSRILLAAALSYVTWWKRNLYLSLIAHCALNAIVWSVSFGALLRMAR